MIWENSQYGSEQINFLFLLYAKRYIILSLELIFFMSTSYGDTTTKKHKINFELSKTDFSWKHLGEQRWFNSL